MKEEKKSSLATSFHSERFLAIAFSLTAGGKGRTDGQRLLFASDPSSARSPPREARGSDSDFRREGEARTGGLRERP